MRLLMIPISLFSTSSFAASKALPTPQVSVLHVFLVLLFTVGIIMLCAYLIRRLTGINFTHDNTIKICTGLTIGTRERILLLQAGETQLLVGVTANGMQTLHVFDEPIYQEGDKPSPSFMQQLTKAMSAQKGQTHA